GRSATSSSTISGPRGAWKTTPGRYCSRTPRPSKSRQPTNVSSSRRGRRSWPATGDSSSDAHESRPCLLPRRSRHERVGDHAGCDDQGSRRSSRRDRSCPQRRDEAGGVDRRRGAKDLVLVRAPGARGQPAVGRSLPEDAGRSPATPVSAVTRLVVAITGATGSVFGIRLLEVLRGYREVETHVVISRPGKRTIVEETDWAVADVEALADHRYDITDIGAAIASGSFRTAGMIIAPCSVKTAAAVAACHSENLIARAADVTLKEGRSLIML